VLTALLYNVASKLPVVMKIVTKHRMDHFLRYIVYASNN